jgi:hypothetical protein
MGRATWWLNGFVALGLFGVALAGVQGRTCAVVASDRALADLEARASADAAALPSLASAYLDRAQPGLAQAALDRLDPNLADRDPELLHLRGRVALASGDLEAAEHLQALTLATCAHGQRCPSWVEARAARQLQLIEARRGSGRTPAPALEERRVMLASL